jgi:iron complex outermembrane receptor protein
MTAGLRYTDEDKTFTTMLTRNASGVTTVPETTVDNSWDAFTPRLGFEYQWADNVMAYVSAAEGFKSGGFNGRSQSLVEIESFDPEKLWAYEIGIKSQWADNTVMLNLAAFYNDYTDIQLTSVHAVEGIIVAVTENAGKARIQGLELEFAAQPVDAILIRAGVGYTDAEYTELDPGATVTLDSKLAKIPEWTGNLVADWTLFTGDRWSLTFGGDLSYRSSFFSDPNNTPILEQDAYSLLGAHARIASADERWQLTLFGTNLADERYLTNGLQAYGSFGTADGTYGPPREYGVTLRAKF